ncbi:hypothetical protein CPB83DRAFT_259884 [Crepidotus variabilis]|uniref:Uncharacterized protein n=1 Tax=Crepidotus variabilis TaxID=179855 RepID=A0A9P6JR72_9AGAR|nr:hypothetical protein CPB83DRAFT_259884 [Crepidotus variabilis]
MILLSEIGYSAQKLYIPKPLGELITEDLEEFEKKKKEAAGIVTTTEETVNPDGTVTTTTTTTTTKVESVVVKKGAKGEVKDDKRPTHLSIPHKTGTSGSKSGSSTPADDPNQPDVHPKAQRGRGAPGPGSSRPKKQKASRTAIPRGDNYGDLPEATPAADEDKGKVAVPHESSDEVVIGLRVYTNKDVACSVEGKLRTGCKNPGCKACEPPTVVTIPAVSVQTTTTTTEVGKEEKAAPSS